MTNDTLAFALLILLLTALLLVLYWWWQEQGDNPLRQRLAADNSPDTASESATLITHDSTPLSPALGMVARIADPLAGSEQDRLKLQALLATAGWHRPEAVGLLLAAKYSCGLALLLVAETLLLSPASRLGLTGLMVALLSLFAGTTLPELMVKVRASRRHDSLARSMPDALDLMVICAEAGLPFPRILKIVSKELALSAPAMADELAYTSAELQILPDRTNALRRLAERTRVTSVESMVGSLIQAERYGTPLAQALRTIADETRSTLILSLEEKAGKLPAQLSLPLMTLILPPVVALVATPALMRVIRSLMT